MKQLLKTVLPNSFYQRKFQRITWSQCGEDLLISNALAALGKSDRCSYLDIGANHPFSLSNTYKFYRSGGVWLLNRA